MLGTLLETILLFMNAVAILNQKRFLKKCTSKFYADGFDTASAGGNPNETITSKSQIIMMVFTLRSIGKCTFLNLFRCSHTSEYFGYSVGNVQLRHTDQASKKKILKYQNNILSFKVILQLITFILFFFRYFYVDIR